MNEFDDLIKELTAAGASDEEITAIIEQQIAARTKSQPTGQISPEQQRELNKQAVGAVVPGVNIPVVGDLMYSLGTAAYSTVTDQLPQSGINFLQKETSNIKQDLESGKGVLPFGIDKMLGIDYAKEIGGTNKLTDLQVNLERSSQIQKQEQAAKLVGEVQDFSNINSASTLASYIGNALGQAAGQIPLAAVSSGSSSYVMEAGIIYDQQLDLLAEKYGMSREDIIRQGLDKPAEGEALAVLSAGLDAFSAGTVTSMFRAAAGKKLKQSVVKEFLKDFVTEGATETAQGALEDLGATQGADTEYKFDLGKAANEFLAGGIGGGGISMVVPGNSNKNTSDLNKAINNTVIEAEADIASATTGDSDLDLEIDDLAKHSATYVDKILSEIESGDINALEQQISEAETKATEAVREKILAQQQAEASAKAAETNAFRLEKLNEFNQTNSYPLWQATNSAGNNRVLEDELRLQEEIGQQPVEQPTVGQTVAPKTQSGQPILESAPAVKPKQSIAERRGVRRPKTTPIPAVVKPKEVKIEKPIVEPKIIEDKAKKLLEKEQENKIRLEEKYNKQLENALKRKPGAKLAIYEKIAEKANEVGLTELAQKADKLSQKEYEIQQAKAEDKEIRKAQLEKVEPKEVRKARQDAEKAARLEREKNKSTNKAVKVFKGLAYNADTDNVVLAKAKDQHYKTIALYSEEARTKARRKYSAEDKANQAKAIEEYKRFRKENNLPSMTDDKIIKHALAETPLKEAVKDITKKGRQNTRDRAAESKEAAKNDIIKELGFDPSEFTSLDEKPKTTKTSDYIGGEFEAMTGSTFDKTKVEKLTPQQVISKLSKGGGRTNTFTDQVLAQVVEGLTKRGKKLSIYNYNDGKLKSSMGFYATGKNQDILFLAEPNFSEYAKEEGGTVLHEVIHGRMELLASAVLSQDRNFSKEISNLYDKAKTNLDKLLRSYITNLVEGKELTREHSELIADTFAYINQFAGETTANTLYNESQALANYYKGDKEGRTSKLYQADIAAQTNKIMSAVYGMLNHREMLAEGLSSQSFAKLLHSIPVSAGTFTYKSNSTLSQVLKYLREALDKLVPKSFKSALDSFQEIIEHFDELYESNPDLEFEYDPYYDIPSFGDYLKMAQGDAKIANLQRNIAANDLAENTEADPTFKADFKKVPSKLAKLNKKIANNIAGTLEKRKEVTTTNDVQEYINRVNKNLSDARKLSPDYAKLILKKIKKLRAERVKAKTAKNAFITEAKNKPEYKISKKFKQDVDDFNLVDIDDLTPKQVNTYLNGLGGLTYNFPVTKDSYNIMIKYGKKKALMAELLPLGEKINKDFIKLLPGVSNPATFVSAISKYDTKTANKLLGNIYGGMMSAIKDATGDSHAFFVGLSKYAEDHKLTHSNLVKIGLVGSIFSTRTNPNDFVEWSKEIKDNAQFAYDATANKLVAYKNGSYKGDLKESEIKREVEFAKSIKETVDKKASSDGILSKQEQEVYNKIIEFAKKNEADFKRNSEGIWGTDFVQRYNYFPTMAQGKDTGGDWNKDELIKTNSDNLFEALGKASEYNELYSKKASANNKRVNPKGYYYEFDALAIAKRWSQSTLFDTYASTELRTMNTVLEDPQFVKAFGVKTRDAFKYHLKSISGTGNKYNGDSGAFVKSIMKIRDKLYTATLATTGQILLQSSSGVAAAAVISTHVNPAKSIKIFNQAVSATFKSMSSNEANKVRQFIEKEGLGIQLRDILFEKYLTPEDYRNWTGAKGLTNKAENITEWALRSGDTLGARIVWWSAYFNAGGTFDNPTRGAILEAERMVGVLQNMSDLSFSAPAFKYDSQWKKMVFGMFYAFKSFSVNSYVNLLYSTRYSLSNADARKVAAAQLGSILAYHTLAIIAVRPAYAALADAFGGDDDDDEEKRYNKLDSIVAETGWDLAFGAWTPAALDAALRWAFNNGVAQKVYGDEYEEFDQYLDSPIHSTRKIEDAYKEAFGPGYAESAELGLSGLSLIMQQAQADEYFDDIDKIEKREFDQKMYYWQIFGTVLASIPTVPLRGDLKRLIEGIIRKKKSERFEQSKASGGGTSSGEGAIDLPVYEGQQYDLNNNDLDLP